jgi:hypothetical protein
MEKPFNGSTLRVLLIMLGIFIGISGWLSIYVVSSNDEKINTLKQDLTKELDAHQRELESIRLEQLSRTSRIVTLEETTKNIVARFAQIDMKLDRIEQKIESLQVLQYRKKGEKF